MNNNSKNLLIVLGLLILAIVGLGAYFQNKSTEQSTSPTVSSVIPTVTTDLPNNSQEKWKIYSNKSPDFSFKLPSNLSVSAPTPSDPALWISKDGNRTSATLQMVYQKTTQSSGERFFEFISENVGFPKPYDTIGNKKLGDYDYYQINSNHMGLAKSILFVVQNGYGYQISYPTLEENLYQEIISTLKFDTDF